MHENVELSGITKQIMPGPSCDLEEWQTLEVNVTLGFASGDIDLLGLTFVKVTLEPRHYLYINRFDLCVVTKWVCRDGLRIIQGRECIATQNFNT